MCNSAEKSGNMFAIIHREYAIFKQPKRIPAITFRNIRRAASQGFIVLKGMTSRKSIRKSIP
jgi:hypothetical protein